MKATDINVIKLEFDLKRALNKIPSQHAWTTTEDLALRITIDKNIAEFIKTVETIQKACTELDVAVTFNHVTFIGDAEEREGMFSTYTLGSTRPSFMGEKHFYENSSHFHQTVTYDDILNTSIQHLLHYFNMGRISHEMAICVEYFVEEQKRLTPEPKFRIEE